jgi:hypothetical protein
MQARGGALCRGRGPPAAHAHWNQHWPGRCLVLLARESLRTIYGVDTVNLASRMEKSRAHGRAILVTECTYRALRFDHVFEPGCLVSVKGKGEVDELSFARRRRMGSDEVEVLKK